MKNGGEIMENQKKKHTIKSFTKIITDTSQRFLASFLDDSYKPKQELEKIRFQLRQAASHNQFVVLQVAESADPTADFETFYGKLKLLPTHQDMVVLFPQGSQQIKMIPIHHIKKITTSKPSSQTLAN